VGSTGSGNINAGGVAVIAVGLIVSWAGLRNQSILTAFRSLAMGEMPQGNPKQPFQPVSLTLGSSGGASGGGSGVTPASASSGPILSIAASLKGQPYCFGGGHGSACAGSCSDCSGYVSCVLNRAGFLRGTLNTDGLARFGVSVPFGQRQPGDVLVWQGGPGGGHCGLVIDGTRMWHNPCTACGGVAIGSYGATRTGRRTIVRRPKAAASHPVQEV
jgi:cell wall-associated NlpC family hydrolase